MNDVKIGDRIVGDSHPVYVVAEMAWSHDGKVENARRIIDIAADAKADAINLHVTSIPDYIVPNYGLDISPLADNNDPESAYNYLAKINLTFDDFKHLADYAHSKGLAVSTMCNDEPSLEFAAGNMNADILMIHPSCVGERDFVSKVAAKGKVMLLYVGGLTLGEVEMAVSTAKQAGCENIILQHGFQSYPTPVEENNLLFIGTLKRLFGLPVAFGDHTDGGDPFAMVIPSVAIGVGANLIEKHLTYDREVKGEDHESALDQSTFALFVKHVRDTQTSLGAPSWKPLGQLQKNYRNVVRKRAVARRALSKGDVLTADDVMYKRSKKGAYPEDIEVLIGRAASTDVVVNGPVGPEQFA